MAATAKSPTPDTTVSLEDIDDYIKDILEMYTGEDATEDDARELPKFCLRVQKGTGKHKNELFIGKDGAAAYPHIHVWNDGNIALSVGGSTNQKIGKGGVISLELLAQARERYKLPAGPLDNFFRWVFSAAS
ncbi:MAG: hypothetical protein AAFN27_01305 [Pseudomonadota bacterium]